LIPLAFRKCLMAAPTAVSSWMTAFPSSVTLLLTLAEEETQTQVRTRRTRKRAKGRSEKNVHDLHAELLLLHDSLNGLEVDPQVVGVEDLEPGFQKETLSVTAQTR
jgi:hypothetical protein